MERIYDQEKIAESIARSKYHEILESLNIDFYLIRYEKLSLIHI